MFISSSVIGSSWEVNLSRDTGRFLQPYPVYNRIANVCNAAVWSFRKDKPDEYTCRFLGELRMLLLFLKYGKQERGEVKPQFYYSLGFAQNALRDEGNHIVCHTT